jgi:hypothetical protein
MLASNSRDSPRMPSASCELPDSFCSARAFQYPQAGSRCCSGHRVDALHHLLPAAAAAVGAQRGAHLPGQRVVGPVGLGAFAAGAQRGALEMFSRLGHQLQRGLLAHRGPGPGSQVGRQGAVPALVELQNSGVGVGGGQPHQGQCGQLGPWPRRGRGTLGKEAQRAVAELGHAGGRPGADQHGGLARRLRPASIDRNAHLAPKIGVAELLRVDQRGGHQPAAVVGVLLGEPGGQRLVVHVLAGLMVEHQRIAADLAVVVHAESRVLDGEVGPVAPLAELEQPVVAQAVFDVGGRPARVEGVQLGLLGLGQPVAELEVVGPHRQRVLGRHRGAARGGQAGAVLLAQGLAGLDDGAVGRSGAGRMRQRDAQGQQGQTQHALPRVGAGALIYWSGLYRLIQQRRSILS